MFHRKNSKRTFEQRLKSALNSGAGSCTVARYYGRVFGKTDAKLNPSGGGLQNPKKRTSRPKRKFHRQK